MTSRERLIRTLNHEDPGPVVVDLGSTSVSGIAAGALARLREALGFPPEPVRVHEPFQLLGEVDQDVREALGIDVAGIFTPTTMFGYRNDGWKNWRLPDGTEVLVGRGFVTTQDADGSTLMHPGGDPRNPPSARLPKGGYYFDNIVRQEPLDGLELDARKDYEGQLGVYGEEDLRYFEGQAQRLYEETDLGLIFAFFGGGIGDVAMLPGPSQTRPRGIRDVTEFYIAHITEPNYVKDLYALWTEVALENLALFREAVGERIQAVAVSGTDFGTQRSELISPDFFREFYKPYFKRMNDWVHAHTSWKTFYHTCGSIVNLLDDLVEAGVDILNPVQCSAEGMNPTMLKERYGKKLVFWGGAVDTQKTLPFGSPEEVKGETLARLRLFAPGGGFVMNAIHNIQQPTPVANILAFFEAARDYNRERGF